MVWPCDPMASTSLEFIDIRVKKALMLSQKNSPSSLSRSDNDDSFISDLMESSKISFFKC